jgi:hypothetical protein
MNKSMIAITVIRKLPLQLTGYKIFRVETMKWLRQLVTGLSSWIPGFAPRSVHVGFVVDRMALGQV